MPLEHLLDFSQYGQPALIRRFIPPDASRWVVDVGAHDGLDGSNSRGFILEGWTALLIEPLPSVFEHLKANSEGYNNIRLAQVACAEVEGEATFHIGSDGPNGQTSSLCHDDIWKHNYSGQEITVQVRTLSNLLIEQGCPPDFGVLLVDAEGMDFEVLSGLDFSRFRPAVICTEIYSNNQQKEHRKIELLEHNGYCLRGRVGSDTIWSSTDLQQEPSSDIYSGKELPSEIAKLPTIGAGAVDVNPAAYEGGVLTISGWAFAPNYTVPGIVLVGVKTQDGIEWQQSPRHPRSDVARHFDNPALFFSGFRVSFQMNVTSPVSLIFVQAQGESRWENVASVTV